LVSTNWDNFRGTNAMSLILQARISETWWRMLDLLVDFSMLVTARGPV
jgi:hypothetical protein